MRAIANPFCYLVHDYAQAHAHDCGHDDGCAHDHDGYVPVHHVSDCDYASKLLPQHMIKYSCVIILKIFKWQ